MSRLPGVSRILGLGLLVAVVLLMVAYLPAEREVQGASPPIAIFAIDESGSMGDEILAVKANVPVIASGLSGWQLGLVGYGAFPPHGGTTVSGDPHIHTTLTTIQAEFANGVDALVASGGDQPGFSATMLAMSGDIDPTGTFPPDPAGVCFILITDEDADIGDFLPPPGNEMKADAVAALSARSAVFFGIVDQNFGTAADDYGPNPGSLAAETGPDPADRIFDFNDLAANPEEVLTAVLDACKEAVTPPIGGIVGLPGQAGTSPAESAVSAEGSGWSPGAYAALAGLGALALMAVAVGGWYARRRLVR